MVVNLYTYNNVVSDKMRTMQEVFTANRSTLFLLSTTNYISAIKHSGSWQIISNTLVH